MSTAKHRDTISSPKKLVDIVTGPTPTVQHLIEEQQQLLPERMPPLLAEKEQEDLIASQAAWRFQANRFRTMVVRWQVIAVIALGYGAVITYIWVNN